jgi:hypothetical protein
MHATPRPARMSPAPDMRANRGVRAAPTRLRHQRINYVYHTVRLETRVGCFEISLIGKGAGQGHSGERGGSFGRQGLPGATFAASIDLIDRTVSRRAGACPWRSARSGRCGCPATLTSHSLSSRKGGSAAEHDEVSG